MNAKLTIPILVLAFLVAMGFMAFGDTVVYDETGYLSSDYTTADDDTIVRSESTSTSGVVVLDTDDFVLIDEDGDVTAVEETTWYDPDTQTLTTVKTPKAKETKVIYAKYLVDEPDIVIARPYTRVYYDPYYFSSWRPFTSYYRIYEPLTWRYAFGGWWVDRDFAIGIGFGRAYSPWYYSSSRLVYDPYLYSPYYYDPYYYAPVPVAAYDPYWDYPYYRSGFSISFNFYSGHYRRHWSPWYWYGGGYYDYYYHHHRRHRYDRVRHTDDHGSRFDYVDGNRPRIDEPYTRVAAARRPGEVGLRDPQGGGLENRSLALMNRNWMDRNAPATRINGPAESVRTAPSDRAARSESGVRNGGVDRSAMRDAPAARGGSVQTARDAAPRAARDVNTPVERIGGARAGNRETLPADRSPINSPNTRDGRVTDRSAGTSPRDEASTVRRGIPSRMEAGEALDSTRRDLGTTGSRMSRSGIEDRDTTTELAGVRRRNVPGLNDLQARSTGSRSIKGYPSTRDRDELIDAARGRTPRNFDRSRSENVQRQPSVNRDVIDEIRNQESERAPNQEQAVGRSSRSNRQNSIQNRGRTDTVPRERIQPSDRSSENNSSTIMVPSRSSSNRDNVSRSETNNERRKPVYLRPSFSSSSRQSREFARVPETSSEPQPSINEMQSRSSSRSSAPSSSLSRSRSGQRGTPSVESFSQSSRSPSRFSAPSSSLNAPRTFSAPSSSGRSLGSNRMPSSSSRMSAPSSRGGSGPMAPASRDFGGGAGARPGGR